MAIIPEDITTVRVDQLPDATLTLDSLFPHTVGTDLKSSTIQELVDLVSVAIGAGSGVGFLAESRTNGQTLPDIPTDPSFMLVGIGTFVNVNGYPDIICTEELNALITVTDHWAIGVEIPINPLSGTVQTVTGSAVDNTDPLNPVINSTGGGGSQDLQSVATIGRVFSEADGTKEIDFNIASGTGSTTGFLSQLKDVASGRFFRSYINGTYIRIENYLSTTDLSRINIQNSTKIIQLLNTTPTYGTSQLQIKPKTSGSGVSTYNTPTDAVAGDYNLGISASVNGGTPVAVDSSGNVDLTVLGGSTNLSYTASPTDGVVNSDTGTDATLPLADTTNAGLLAPADKTKLNNTSGTNTGDNSANTNSNAYADAKVTDAIVDGVTAIAPSQNAVFDALALKAPLASPALTGNPTAPTQTANDNSTKIATTAYVDSINKLLIKFRSGTATSAWTGATTEHEMLAITIPIGTFPLTDFININHLRLVKTTSNSTVTWRIKISTSSTMPTGNTDRVAVFTDGTGARSQEILRTFWQNGGNLTGVDFATSLNSDIAIVSTTLSTMAFNNTTTQYYLYVSAQLTNSADSVYIANYEITN